MQVRREAIEILILYVAADPDGARGARPADQDPGRPQGAQRSFDTLDASLPHFAGPVLSGAYRSPNAGTGPL